MKNPWINIIFTISVINILLTNASTVPSQIKDIRRSNKINCNYYQTTNVTDGRMELDKSWNHNGLRYPIGFYAVFDYIFLHNGTKIIAAEHIRGCTCLLGPCINSCCKTNYGMSLKGVCEEYSDSDRQIMWDVVMDDGPVKVDITKMFNWIERRPSCDKTLLEPGEIEEDQWYLYKVIFL